MNTKLFKSASAVSILAAAPLVFAPAAQAQLEEIVVTAQKREQTLQDVPISITAVSAEMLEKSGVNDIKDLINVVPGLMVTTTSSNLSTTARIRGVGTVGDNTGLESSVGVFIDGVFRNRNGVGFNDLGRLERVEVLRGPQGTLFGKNTSAGVMSLVTKAPSFEREYGFEATVGNLDYKRVSGYFSNGNDAETAAFSLFGVYNKRDGYVDVSGGNGPAADRESYNQDYYSLRAQLLLEPTDMTSIRIIGDYTDRDEDCCAGVQTTIGASAALIQSLSAGNGLINPANPEARQTIHNRGTDNPATDGGISAQIDHEFDNGVALTSITAYRNFDTFQDQDIDYTGADIAFADNGERSNEFNTFTQELRLAGEAGRLDWMVGGYYADEKLDRNDSLRLGSAYEAYVGLLLSAPTGAPSPTFVSTYVNGLGGAFIPGYTPIAPGGLLPLRGGQVDSYSQDTTTLAAFTHNTFAVSDRLDAIIGLRYTNEQKDATSEFQTNAPGCAVLEGIFGDNLQGAAAVGGAAGALGLTPTQVVTINNTICLPWNRSAYDGQVYEQDRSFDDLQGVAKLSFEASDNATIYGGVSRGFKSGGFNLDRDFSQDATGQLLATPDTSFDSEIITAFELGANTILADGRLRLNLNAFYQKIDDFQLNTFTGTSFVVNNIEEATSKGAEADFAFAPDVDGLSFTGGLAYIDAKYGDDISDATLAGQQMTLSPEFSANLGATYATELSDRLNAEFYLEGRYVSEYNTGSDLDPEKLQEGFGTLNGRVTLSGDNSPLSLEFWAKNLTDETYKQVGFDSPLQGSDAFSAFLSAPRTFGLTLRGDW